MKILNLYSGLGGNRKHWDGHNITAVEIDEKIADVYKDNYPGDNVIIGDAHEYLQNNFTDYDFIWSSPPCQTHTKMIISGRNRKAIYPDLRLYEEIILLKQHFEGLWLVENVKPYYPPLIPGREIGRHLFWCNFPFRSYEAKNIENFIDEIDSEKIKQWLGIHYEGNLYYKGNHNPNQVLRNCVHPDIGNHILLEAQGIKICNSEQLELI